MITRTLKLNARWTEYLRSLPQSAMGFRNVSVTLRNGNIFPHHKVFSSSLLVLVENENFTQEDIQTIVLD